MCFEFCHQLLITYETVKNQREDTYTKKKFRERFFHFQTFESYGSAAAEGGSGGVLDPPVLGVYLVPPQLRHCHNLEFPLIITKIVPFSIIFDHCENDIIRIRIRIPFFSKGEKPRLQGF